MSLRFGICGLFLFIAAGVSAQEQKPLNVVMIVVDDLRDELGCYGQDMVQSPHIDRLAARGMRFDRAYCQYPVCNPSRSSFLTGLRPDTTRVLDNNTHFRNILPDVVTLPQCFRQQGYEAYSLGKIFHRGLTRDGKRGDEDDPISWDRWTVYRATETGQRGEGRNLTGGKLNWCHWKAAEGGDTDQPDGQIAAEAVRLLEEKGDRPLFLAVGFQKPHDPFIAPAPYFEPYPLASIPVHRDPVGMTPPPSPGLSLPEGLMSAFREFGDPERREFLRAYWACTSFMDAQVGKVLAALDRLEMWDSTVVLLMGDHGYHLGERGWWNKNTTFEFSAQAPLIVWAPGQAGMGRPTRGIVEFVDLYPTLVDLCGLRAPVDLEGSSFRNLLSDPGLTGKSAAFTQVKRGESAGRSIRTDRWRLVEWDRGEQGVELYDHAADPGEYRNLADDPQWAEVRSELAASLHAQGDR